MSITFPISLPSSPGAFAFRLTQVSTASVNESSFTGTQQVVEWPREFWKLSVGMPPMERADAAAWVAALVSLRGMTNTFLAGDPSAATPQGVATGSPLVNGNQAGGSKTLATKGWTHNVTGILKAGDYIQLGTGSGSRLHMVLKDVNSDSSGNATLDIFPRLRVAVATNDVITISNCVGVFRLAANEIDFSIDAIMHFGIDYNATEAL